MEAEVEQDPFDCCRSTRCHMYHESYRNNSKSVLVFSGFNQRAVIAFLRTLEHNGTSYAVIAKSEDDDIFLTEYRKAVLAVRRTTALDLEDIADKVLTVKKKLKSDIYYIAPTTEALNRFILEHRDRFRSIGCEIPLVADELYEKISDKYSFGKLCSKHGICIPKELSFDMVRDFPVVAKPKRYFSSVGKTLNPIIVSTIEELTSFRKEYCIEDFYFQEYIDGRSLYLLYYFGKDGRLYKFSQENIIQQPDGKSIVAATSSDFHKTGESRKYEELFQALDFSGFVMVEVRQNNGTNYMIEANPRFWGPSQLFVDSGSNLFEPFLYDLGMIDCIPELDEPENIVRYFWFGGIMETYRKGKRLKYHSGDDYDLITQLPTWLQADLYRRPDTLEIFKKEISR